MNDPTRFDAREVLHGMSKWATIASVPTVAILAATGGVPAWLVFYGAASAVCWAATRPGRRGR